MLLQYTFATFWYRVIITGVVIALVAALSSDTFVNGRHGDFLNNGKVVINWGGSGWDTWKMGEMECRPRKYKDGTEFYEISACDADCTDYAT